MAQTAVYLHNQASDEAPAHRISRKLALSFLGDGHAKREGEGIRLKEGRSLQSLKAEYRERPKPTRSTWIPEELPPAEVQGLITVGIPNPETLQSLYEIGGRSVMITRRALVVMAREFCSSH